MKTLILRAHLRFALPRLLIISCATLLLAPSIQAQRRMEHLGRGVVAVRQADGTVFVGWRLLGTDPEAMAFNLYRATDNQPAVKLNPQSITAATHFVDRTAELQKTNAYFVKPVLKGKELFASAPFLLPTNSPVRQYLSVPLQTPTGTTPNDISVGDLDGDGEYEIVIHMTARGRDNSRGGFTDPAILQAYKLNGTLLWTINLGLNIREGAHYTQFMVYDLDGDGIAEVACKTADGTVDGTGKVIGDAKADWSNRAGHIVSGPEYLTVFDGRTGAALATANYFPPRHPAKRDPTPDELDEVWGDGNANRSERYLACIAYLDGKRPSLVMCRGYYTRTVLAAWNWRDGKLSPVWTFDSDAGPKINRAYRGQGNHNLSVADVDNDGKDEIVYGACVIDHNGKGLYSTGLGHGDALHVSDLDPTRPGLEVFDIQERVGDAGAHLRDACTGKNLWKKPTAQGESEGPGRGLAADIDPRHKGAEMWAGGEGGVQGLFNTKGELVSAIKPRTCNFAVWWDGDLLRELLNGNRISKWDWTNSSEETIFEAEDCTSNNGSKSTPALSADILGDWREEVIWRTRDNRGLRIYTTTTPTEHRFYTLMHDPQYRLAIAWQNVAYNQPPHPGFYLGDGMKLPSKPNITTRLIPVRSR
ncbi:MAG: rhamnogalacturonan lyase [Verrucomicrobiota bacterium]